MQRRIKFVCSLVIAAGLGLATDAARAAHPAYLLLHSPTADMPHQPTYGYSPGYGYGVSTHAYSYGWFGAQPSPQWSRHFGYHRGYTQWSSR